MKKELIPPKDKHGQTLMTKKYIQDICEYEGLFTNPIYNTKLYLNSKNFSKIENLEEYVAAEGLWLQSNFISKIEGLTTLTKLKFLFLQDNSLTHIEGLETLRELVRLDLSYNKISKIENLENLTKLKDLIISHNNISSIQDLKGLESVKSTLSFLNLSKNKIHFDEELLPWFKSLEHVIFLELQNNPICDQMDYYRKRIIGTLEQITYLDNKAIEPAEKRFALAFVKGGEQLEKEERDKYQFELLLKTINNREEEREYYKKVNERMKRTVANMKIECQKEKLRLLQRKEELMKSNLRVKCGRIAE